MAICKCYSKKTSNTEDKDQKSINSQNKGVYCLKGDKGDKVNDGSPGKYVTCKQIELRMKRFETKLDALSSYYKKEIIQLRQEVHALKSNTLHPIGSQLNPAKSCKEIYEMETFSPSGPYYLNITGNLTKVNCIMEDGMKTCPAGSTLVLKIDGTKDTFAYSSPLWTNKDVWKEKNGEIFFAKSEIKLSTYWGVSFNQVCVIMQRMESFVNETKSLVIRQKSTSLYDLLVGGEYHPVNNSWQLWNSLLPSYPTQPSCVRQGFNAHEQTKDFLGTRIGMILSNNQNCTLFDAFIGFGTKGRETERNISCGSYNTTLHNPVPGFGYVFVY